MNHEIVLPTVAVASFSMEEDSLEVEALVVVYDPIEKEQMGLRRKKSWPEARRDAILELDDESGLKQTLPRALKGEDKQALWSVCIWQMLPGKIHQTQY